MAVNMEIKARAADFDRQQALAAEAADGPPEILIQEDTFFNVKAGRLKFRIEGSSGHLIAYERESVSGPKPSQYQILHTPDPLTLKTILTRMIGVRGVVTKRRLLYRVGHTRVHFDEVEGLGRFIEIEVLIVPGCSEDQADAVARGLMTHLQIERRDLIAGAYMDLLDVQ